MTRAVVLAGLAAGCGEVVEPVPIPPPTSSRVVAAPSPDPAAPRDSTESEAVGVVIDAPSVEARTRDGQIRGQALGAENRERAFGARLTLRAELARYPKAALRRIGLRQVVLCERLAFDATPCTAFADVEHGRIFIDVDSVEDDAGLARTLHHELFHQVDYADDGRLDADPAWEALNPPGFRYAQDAQRYQEDPGASAGPAPPGFLSRYATSSPTEDKAVLYAALITDRAATLARADADPILARKIGRLRAALEDLGPDALRLLGP